ncbi:MAG: hypothetical protein WC375_13045 [Methanomassiliicoccales archaeon]|jgi:hypothetical protein
MKITLSKAKWEEIGKKAGWFKSAQIIPDDGFADGGEAYTDEEMAMIEDDNTSRRRTVKVTFNDGDTISTGINGSKKEIEDYYLKHEFVKQDETTMHHGVKVEFLE